MLRNLGDLIMTCNFLSNHSILKDIRKYFGTNVSEFLKVMNFVFKNNTEIGSLEFKEDFKTWWSNNRKDVLDIKTITPTVLKNAALKYYAYKVPAFSNFIRDINSGKSITFGYTSSTARKEAKHAIAQSIYVQYFNEEKSKGSENVTNKLSVYATRALTGIKQILAYTLSQEVSASYESVFNMLTPGNVSAIRSLITEDTPITTRNLAALYIEMSSIEPVRKADGTLGKTPQREFFDEVMLDGVAAKIKTTKEDKNDDYDGTIRDLNLHHGEIKDYLGHVGERIKGLLTTIPKCNSTEMVNGNYDFNLDNAVGLPIYHDSVELCSLLYSCVARDDKESMLESIYDAANTMPGYHGLIKIYNVLKENPDMLAEFFTNFGKHVISKIQTVVSYGIGETVISNKTANRLDVLTSNFINDYRTSVSNVDLVAIKKDFSTMSKVVRGTQTPTVLYILKGVTERTELTEKVLNRIYNLLVKFYPNLDIRSFANFVYQKGKTPYETLRLMYWDLESAIQKAEGIARAEKDKQIAIHQAIVNNKKKKEENLKKPGTYSAEDFENVSAIQKRDVMMSTDFAPAISLAEHLLPYTVVKVNMNSVNVHGNQSSDVLNSSLLTRLKSIFESQYNNEDRRRSGEKSPLQLLAEDYHLDQTTQFKLSNILIEQDGHAGLFRKDKRGKYVPTEYASSLLQFNLFGGAANKDNGVAVLYNQMSKGDYIGTVWINYFNNKNINSTKSPYMPCGLANYFLRIPSDAPKTFSAIAPRYSISSNAPLFRATNEAEYNTFISDIVDELTNTITQEDADTFMEENDLDLPLTDDMFASHILSEKDAVIEITPNRDALLNLKNVKRGDRVKVRMTHTITIEHPTTKEILKAPLMYLVEGTYNPVGNGSELTDIEFKGFYPTKEDGTSYVQSKTIKSYIARFVRYELSPILAATGAVTYKDKTYSIQYEVVPDHQLFRQLKSAFKQELIDGVAAAKLMFETTGEPEEINGKVITKHRIKREPDGTPILRTEWKKSTNGLSPFYHTTEDGKVYAKGKLLSRVFESDRFIMFDSNNNIKRNYGQEVIDNVIRYISDDNIDSLIDWIEDDNGNLVDINLSSEQEDAINKMISDYIVDITFDTKRRLEANKNFIKNEKIDVDDVADFILNYQLMYINCNELLEGDTKYYKNVQTFLKRTKEYQASGNPYSTASTRRTLTTKEADLGKIGWNIKQRDRFYAITIRNTNTFDKKVLGNLEKVLADKEIMDEHALTPKQAHDHIYGKDGKGGYTDAVVNDAQSYITFEEWVRRVAARGELEKYRSLIDKIVNNQKLTIAELDTFIQVQKNIYYDMYYDKTTKRVVPRQIKNAEFVLVPAFVEGTELQEVYDFMRNNGIDQLNTLETSKASNNYIIDVFDKKKGTIRKDVINAAKTVHTGDARTNFEKLVDNAKQAYSYNYLYEQQKTPQHVNTTNKLAIQIAKKVVDNIPEGHELYPVKEDYFKVLTANIKDSFQSLMKELNVPLDENGNIDMSNPDVFTEINYEKFNKRLREELARTGVDENTLDYVTIDENADSYTKTTMPNYFSIVMNKLESITQAIVNRNITRQTLTGFHAAQITNIGFTKLGEKKTIQRDNRLSYHPAYYISSTGERIEESAYETLSDDAKKNYKLRTEAYIGVGLPLSAFGINRKDEHYRNMTDDEIIKELHDKGLDEFIGYRIPTEGKQSIAVMRLEFILEDAQGSTIVVPDEWVPQTGSGMGFDFVYGIQFKSYKDAFGEIHKIEYSENFDVNNWVNYVAKNIGGKIGIITKEVLDEIKAKAKGKTKEDIERIIRDHRQALQDIETEAFKAMPVAIKNLIKAVHARIKSEYGGKKSRQQYKDALANELLHLGKIIHNDIADIDESGELAKAVETYTDEDYKAIANYYNSVVEIINDLNDTPQLYDYNAIKSGYISSAVDKIKVERLKAYEEAAELYGLQSLEDFIKEKNADIVANNTRAARDNRIVEDMLKIMRSPLSLA